MVDLGLKHCYPISIGFLLSSYTTDLNSFEMIGHKTEVGIIPKMFHWQSAKGNLNLWLCDQKSVGFLLSWWCTYVWNLKVIGQKYKSVSRLQGKVLRNLALTHSRTYSSHHMRTGALIYPFQRLIEGKMSGGYYFLLLKELFLYLFDVLKNLNLYFLQNSTPLLGKQKVSKILLFILFYLNSWN